MSIIIPANSAVSGGFDVANSCMFNDADSPYMYKAGVSGNRDTYTFSYWVKRGALTTEMRIGMFSGTNSTSATTNIWGKFNADDTFVIIDNAGSGNHLSFTTNRKFSDPAAWYHFVVAVDTTQGTEADRVKIYVNGVQETSFSQAVYPSQNADTLMGSGSSFEFVVSGWKGNSNQYFDGYLAEVVHIDGLQLAPTSFGEFDEDSGIWKPIDVSGLTFGSNGFYLDFQDSANLGNDANGGTDFTETNIAATDQATDTCTNNFSVLNPLIYITNTGTTLSEGNNKIVTTASAHRNAFGTINVSSGKWYCEIKIDSLGGSHQKVGVSTIDNVEINKGTPSEFSGNASGYAYRSDGQKEGGGGSTSSYGNSFTSGDTLGIAMDLTNLKLYFSKNGTFQNSGNPESGATGTGAAFSLAAGESYIFAINQYGANTSSFNFGSPFFAISSGNADGDGYGNFEYAVPSGYFSLNSKNLAEYG